MTCFSSIVGRTAVEISLRRPISLKFTYLPQNRTEFNFLLLKGIILTTQTEVTGTEKFDDSVEGPCDAHGINIL